MSPGALAVAWTLAWRGVSGAIVGARSPAQVDDWLAAASLELTRADLLEIDAAIRQRAPAADRRFRIEAGVAAVHFPRLAALHVAHGLALSRYSGLMPSSVMMRLQRFTSVTK